MNASHVVQQRLAREYIADVRVDVTTYDEVSRQVLQWAKEGTSRRICVANVHMVMEAYADAGYREVVNEADLVTPDGMPLVWMLRAMGRSSASRIYGPTLMLHVCEAAAREGVPIGLYGGTQESLRASARFLEGRCPGIQIACQVAPPFRPLTEDEDEVCVSQILQSGARILFVGIGCPKQERWIEAHMGRLPLVMLGVGAAFDFHSGRVRQAPSWMQAAGLEWLFRVMMEPRRLWKRYATHNPHFLLLATRQLLRSSTAPWKASPVRRR